MKYSVVTTVYNDSNNIVRFLDEIVLQNSLPQEIIIADGGSNDDTVEIIKKYAVNSKVPIKILSGERLNISEGFNVAIKSATSKVVAITAVGNHYPSNFFEKLADELKKEQSLDAAYSIIKGYDDTIFSKLYNRTFIGKGMIMGYPSNHGVLIKKQVVEELGFFYEKFNYAGEDYELFQHFLEKGKKAKCVLDTELQWETPKTFKEYCKQTKVYLVGRMQCCNNKLLLKMLSKNIIYVVIFLLAIMAFLFDKTRIISYILWIIVFLFNIKGIIQSGLKGMLLKNSKIFLEVYYSFKERKYFLEKNKIVFERRVLKNY